MLKQIFLAVIVSVVVSLFSVAIYFHFHVPKNTFGDTSQFSGINLGIDGIVFGQTDALTGAGIKPVKVSMAATSSVVCSIPNPFTGTSTLLSFMAQITGGITGTNIFYLSTSTAASASSTPALVAARSVASTAQDTMFWNGFATTTASSALASQLLSTNDNTGAYNVVIGPNQFVNYRIASTTPGTFATYYTGTCSAVFQRP